MQQAKSFRHSPNLPTVRCASLKQLAKLVRKEQEKREYDPGFRLTGSDHVVSDSHLCVSDLLGVKPRGYHDEEVDEIFARQPFYWERWNIQSDVGKAKDDKTIIYDFNIYLSNIEIGTIERTDLLDDTRPLPVHFTRWVHFVETRFGEVDLWAARFDRSVLFTDAVFEGPASFTCNLFNTNAPFRRATFMGQASFNSSRFTCDALFEKTTFNSYTDFSACVFEGLAAFADVKFKGETKFVYTQFKDNMTFEESSWAEFSHFRGALFVEHARFNKATFKNTADFSDIILAKDLLFDGCLFERSLLIDNIRLSQAWGRHFISLTNTSVQAKISFSMLEEAGYSQIQLGLYGSDIAYFCCDDYEWYDVTLLHEPVAWADESLSRLDELKNSTERYLHELRIKRRILQNMNWGDLADKCYAEIMDQQLRFKRLEALRRSGYDRQKRLFWWWVERLIYKKIFGWGIRLANTAAFAGLVLVGFWMAYFILGRLAAPAGVSAVSLLWQSLLISIESFLGLDLPDGTPTAITQLAIAEAALGYLVCTVAVVVLARKFMRF